ncbi:MAG TPA: tRNA-dihydrouridine synthase [Tepidisphaeraceae bacterium]|jgi:nifR3 family TIM-barrel protein
MPRIGSIELSSPFCQAGLAGYSDRAMRLVARRRGCAYAVTEALLDVILLNGGLGLKKSIDINDEDHPIAGQVIGSEPETVTPAAAILWDAGYDVIDLNYACPVKKIKNKARGGHMLRDVSRAVAIMRAVRDRLPDAPISLSLRRSFDDAPQSPDALHSILDEAWSLGFVAARIHGRTVEQKYQGTADWESLRQIKAAYPTRTIIGSGDVFSADDAVRMKVQTGVDIVWIARGAIGNPWVFAQSHELLSRVTTPDDLPTLQNQNISPPTIAAQRDALQEHFDLAMQLHGEQVAGRRMRKMGIKYARFHPQAEAVKRDFISAVSLTDWRSILTRWYADDAPGVWPAQGTEDEVNDAVAACGIE